MKVCISNKKKQTKKKQNKLKNKVHFYYYEKLLKLKEEFERLEVAREVIRNRKRFFKK